MPVPPARGSIIRRIVFTGVMIFAEASRAADGGLVINPVDGGGSMPANMVGGGNITTIAAQTAGVWESAFASAPGTWEVNLSPSTRPTK